MTGAYSLTCGLLELKSTGERLPAPNTNAEVRASGALAVADSDAARLAGDFHTVATATPGIRRPDPLEITHIYCPLPWLWLPAIHPVLALTHG